MAGLESDVCAGFVAAAMRILGGGTQLAAPSAAAHASPAALAPLLLCAAAAQFRNPSFLPVQYFGTGEFGAINPAAREPLIQPGPWPGSVGVLPLPGPLDLASIAKCTAMHSS